MKLGESCIDPLTGKSGFVVRFIGGQPIGRDADGQQFKAGTRKGRPPIAGAPCRIKVYGVPGDWMRGERVDNSRAKVTDGHPIWHGMVLSDKEAEFEAVREESCKP